MFAFKCIFNGTSSHFSELCWKEGVSKKKKHLIKRLGIGSGKELHAISDQSCCVYFLKERSLIINSDLFFRADSV